MGIIAEGGWLSQQGCPFEQSYEIYFEEATLKFHSYWGQVSGSSHPGRKDPQAQN